MGAAQVKGAMELTLLPSRRARWPTCRVGRGSSCAVRCYAAAQQGDDAGLSVRVPRHRVLQLPGHDGAGLGWRRWNLSAAPSHGDQERTQANKENGHSCFVTWLGVGF